MRRDSSFKLRHGVRRAGVPQGTESRSITAGMGAFLPAPVMSGIAVTPETSLTLTAVYSAINVLSTDVASLPLEVATRLPGGGHQPVTDDPRYNLVYCEPNEDTTSIRYRTAAMGHVLGWGNSYSRIERLRDGYTPGALKLLSPRPTDTRPERTRDGRLVYTTEGGRGPTLLAEDVIHIAGLGWDGLIGYSPIAFARQAVGLGIAAEQFGAAFFGNGTTPGGFLKKPTKMTPDAMARLRDQWERVHQGTINAHRTVVLEEGLTWEKMTVDPEAAQFLESRKFQVLEIARIFNLPPHKIGDYSQSHRANVEESNLDYLITTLRPWLVTIEQELNKKLFTSDERREGLHVVHNMDDLLRGNTQARTQKNESMRRAGVISADEWRQSEGLNPIGPEKGGDLYLVQSQNVPLADTGRATPTPPQIGAGQP